MAPEPDDLDALKARIEAARGDTTPPPEPSISGLSFSSQIGIEMIAGVLVGSFIGYWIDRAAGTSPLFFIFCFFLGIGGSVMTIKRLLAKHGDSLEK